MKNLDGVKRVDYDFTCHGLHINAKGKIKVANTITQILTQPSKQNDIKLIPMQCIDTTSDPAHLRSITEALNKETVHQDNEQEKVEGDKLPSQTCIQQKMSSRKKKKDSTLHNRRFPLFPSVFCSYG
jgi:hypothetical protein